MSKPKAPRQTRYDICITGPVSHVSQFDEHMQLNRAFTEKGYYSTPLHGHDKRDMFRKVWAHDPDETWFKKPLPMLHRYEEAFVLPYDGFVLLSPSEVHPHASNPADAAKEREGMLFQLFHLTSLFMGLVVNDECMHLYNQGGVYTGQKPVVVMDWFTQAELFENMVHSLRSPGVNGRSFKDVVYHAQFPDEAVDYMEQRLRGLEPAPVASHKKNPYDLKKLHAGPEYFCTSQARSKPDFVVGVFCSAGTTASELLADARYLGEYCADMKWGLASGLNRYGAMGAVHDGAKAQGGWTCGVSTPTLSRVEVPPDEFDTEWMKKDISRRIEKIISASNVLVALPGGLGTLEEITAAMYDKMHDNPAMRGKHIVLYNKDRFYDPLIKMAKLYKLDDLFEVANTREELAGILNREHAHSRTHPPGPKPRAQPHSAGRQ